jgi:hypothetical protein
LPVDQFTERRRMPAPRDEKAEVQTFGTVDPEHEITAIHLSELPHRRVVQEGRQGARAFGPETNWSGVPLSMIVVRGRTKPGSNWIQAPAGPTERLANARQCTQDANCIAQRTYVRKQTLKSKKKGRSGSSRSTCLKTHSRRP